MKQVIIDKLDRIMQIEHEMASLERELETLLGMGIKDATAVQRKKRRNKREPSILSSMGKDERAKLKEDIKKLVRDMLKNSVSIDKASVLRNARAQGLRATKVQVSHIVSHMVKRGEMELADMVGGNATYRLRGGADKPWNPIRQAA
jgi:DNA invertase Pin-like site-specific DNA recombinase